MNGELSFQEREVRDFLISMVIIVFGFILIGLGFFCVFELLW